ncbi:DUF6090 family protein [Reichenbachiella sp.]|uniref:DUF6090 family protein n=1 Tax=Reichenbachiella sp. TaxID=2184521 RepID=UPI003B5B7AA9
MVDNKTGKYLIYALSEILLVVVGILIALQIEGWKEEKENNEKTKVILGQILTELEHNVLSGVNNIIGFNKKDSLMKQVLDRKLAYQDYAESDELRSLITSYYWLELYNSAYQKLMAHQEKLDPTYIVLTEQIVNLYSTTMYRVQEEYAQIGDNVDRAVKHMSMNCPWYSNTLPQHMDQQIEYMLSDPIYFNMVKSMKGIGGENFLKNMIDFNHEAIDVYKAIHKKLGLNTPYPEVVDRIKDYPESVLNEYEGIYTFGNKSHELQVKFGKLGNHTEQNWIYFTEPDRAEYLYEIDLIEFIRNEDSLITGFEYTYRGEKQYWSKVD